MKNITQNEFKSEVRDFKGVALVDFYADWCGPCKALSPMLDELSTNNTDTDVKYLKINVDSEQGIAEALGIQSIPTVMIFKDGQVADRMVGVQPKQTYLDAIASAKNTNPDAPKKVTVFSTPTCPYCHMVKAYLKDKEVEFEDVDVSKDQQKAVEMVKKSGQMGVPQLWINNQVVVGFNPTQINMLLGIR